MDERSVASESPPQSPQNVVLSLEEWNEIEDSVTAFHSALVCGAGQEGEEAELLKAVYGRLSAALSPVRRRMED